MENVLTLEINDIELFINGFSETLIDANRDTQRPEVYVRISLEKNDPALLESLVNIDIKQLNLKKNGESIWLSNKYTIISRLALDVLDGQNEYVLNII